MRLQLRSVDEEESPGELEKAQKHPTDGGGGGGKWGMLTQDEEGDD